MIGITGGNGVIGRILISKYIQKNAEISVFEGDITVFEDIKNWFEKKNITFLIHLASKVAINEVQNNLTNAFDVNVSGTINILKAIAIQNNKTAVFYASSSHVYKSSKYPLNENDIVEPINSYGLTKHIAEQLLNDYKKNNPDFGLCIGRIFSFYHDFQKPPFLYPTLKKRFQTEDLQKPFVLNGAKSTRDFLNAEDVCEIIIKLVSKNYQGTINIASGKVIKIIDFAQKIAPQKLNFQIDESENPNHLVADISLLNQIISYEQ